MLLDMPVDHDPAASVAGMPLGHEVLVPRAELLGIRGTGRGRLPPNVRQATAENRVDHLRDGIAQQFLADEPAPYIEQVAVAFTPRPAADPLQAGIGSDAV